MRTVIEQFQCEPRGIHGISHWARVRVHAITLGRQNGADLRVLELFAMLHDSRRLDDFSDPDHGKRAAEFASSLQGKCFHLERRALHQLLEAIEGHSSGQQHTDKTIQTCWDADRLDLVRLMIDPDPQYLSELALTRVDAAWNLIYPRSSVSG